MKLVKVTLKNKATITQSYNNMEEAIDWLIKLEEDGYIFDKVEHINE